MEVIILDIHVCIDGKIIDLKGFFSEEMSCYIECLKKYNDKINSTELISYFQSQYIELLMKNSELNKTIQDFYSRLSIEQKKQEPPTDKTYLNQNPVQPDEFISANEAARRKDVSLTSIRAAIESGKISGHRERKGVLLTKNQAGGQWKLSTRSVEQYNVNVNRKRSGKRKNGGSV